MRTPGSEAGRSEASARARTYMMLVRLSLVQYSRNASARRIVFLVHRS